MSPATDKAKSVFLAALDRLTDAERTTFLDEACADDGALRQRVEMLLRAHERADRLLDRTASEHLDQPIGVGASSDVSLAFLDPPTRPGSLGRLGHYEVLQVVGRGSMGLVFRSFDEKLQRVVAIKALALQLAASGSARQRFTREARAAAAVSHDNVIAIYAVEDAGPIPFLVMQFIDGLTLQEKLDRSGALPLMETLRIGLQIAEGLAAAHRQGLVHRDVKPANILLENGVERVKLTDFGLARAGDDGSVTQTGVLAGTPMYMSPEQAQGEHVDCRSDLFSLGSVLYTMCTGQPPFRGSTAISVLKRVCEETPRPVRESNPELPQWLSDFVNRLHAKLPADRFATAREVADLLTERLADLQHGGPSSVPPAVGSAPAQTSPRVSQRPRWTVAVAMLLLTLGGLGFAEATGTTNLHGSVIRLLSPEGTLVVEVDDPNVSVQIDGSDLVITGAGAKEIRLKPGSYMVEARKDGKVVSRELVSVTKTGRQVVRVSQESLAAIPKNDAPPVGTTTTYVDTVAWERTVLARTPAEQVKAVAARLQLLNSKFDGKVEPMIEKGEVIGLKFCTNEVIDLSPVRALTGLQSLTCEGRDGKGKLTDLTPLKGLKLRSLNCIGNPISDMSPLRNTPLTHLYINDTRVTDLTPLRDMALKEIACDFKAERDAEILRSLKSLETINSTSAASFWRERIQALIGFPPLTDLETRRIAALPAIEQVEEVRKELKRRNPDFDGSLVTAIENGVVTKLRFSTTAVTDIAPVRALTQLRELECFAIRWTTGKLIDLAPLSGLPLTRLSFDDNPVHDLRPLKGMKLTALKCGVTKVADLSPLQGMPLEVLYCGFSRVADLSPLKGMKLIRADIQVTGVSDLSPLRGMPLVELNCYGLTRLTDLSPLSQMPLRDFNIQKTGVSDLAPLKGMQVERLTMPGTKVTDLLPLDGLRTLKVLSLGNLARLADLSPLKTLPLEQLFFENFNAGRDAKVLREISTLKTINYKPVAEFWKEVDAKAND